MSIREVAKFWVGLVGVSVVAVLVTPIGVGIASLRLVVGFTVFAVIVLLSGGHST